MSPQYWTPILAVHKTSFWHNLAPLMSMLGLLVIIKPISTCEMTILAKKNHKDWSSGAKNMAFFRSGLGIQFLPHGFSWLFSICTLKINYMTLLVIIRPISTCDLTILAIKNHKEWSSWAKNMAFFRSGFLHTTKCY